MENKNVLDSLRKLSQGRKSSEHVTYTERTLFNVIGIDSIEQLVISLEYLSWSEPN